MKYTPKQLNFFIMLKLPSAWICGVRLKDLSATRSRVQVKYRWINQNPFKSMYFAVQAMAAELSTGALVISSIKESGCKISMLVARNNSEFTKKATGKISFICEDGVQIRDAIEQAITTGEGKTCWMESTGINEEGVKVSEFNFEWTVRVRQ